MTTAPGTIVTEYKVCPHCGEEKPKASFHRKGPNGRLRSWCKACINADNHERAVTQQYHLRYRYPNNTPRNAPSDIARRAAWNARNAERVHLIQINSSRVFRAIKAGELVRPSTCSECGSGGAIEASHEDYSRPLDVTWLCRPCHRRRDREDPKTLKAVS